MPPPFTTGNSDSSNINRVVGIETRQKNKQKKRLIYTRNTYRPYSIDTLMHSNFRPFSVKTKVHY